MNSETNVYKIGLKVWRQARESLPGFAAFVAEAPKYRDIQVFLGRTLIHRGVRHLGFEVQEMPLSGLNRWQGWLHKIIVRVYHPKAALVNSKLLQDKPKLVWISRERLMKNWSITVGELPKSK